MTLKTQIEADLPVFFNTDDFAETVTYNGVTITAVLGYGEIMSPSPGSVKLTRTLWVSASDVPSPAYRDVVVVGGDTWYVGPEDEHRQDGYVWELPLYSDERPTI